MKEAIELWDSHTLKDGEILSKPSIDAYFRPKDPNKAYFRIVEGEYQQARTAGLHHAIVEAINGLDFAGQIENEFDIADMPISTHYQQILTYLKSQL